MNTSFYSERSQPAEICVYDHSGRIVDTVFEGIVPVGNSSLVWIPSAAIPSGSYIIQFLGEEQRKTERCLFITN